MNLFIHLLLAVRADIPVHCEKPDYAGYWKVKESSLIHTTGVGTPWCGLNAPNTNQANLDHNGESLIEESPGREFVVSLLESQYVTKGRHIHMMAKTDDWPGHGHQGHEWTTTYDEGLQIFMRHQGEGPGSPQNASLLENGRQSQFQRETHYFALSKYECLPGNPHCGKNGDGESATGEAAGYRSMCGKIIQGWVYRPSYKTGDGSLIEEEHGCWMGHMMSDQEVEAHKAAGGSSQSAGLLGKDAKIATSLVEPGTPGHPDHPDHPRNKVHAIVFVDDVEDPSQVLGQGLKMHTSYHHSDFEGGLPDHGALLELHNTHLDGGFTREWKHTRRAGVVKRKKYSSKTMMHFRDACEAENSVTKGKTASLVETETGWDWRQQLGNKWNTPVLNQGACGSCYDAALAYMVQSRFNIEMHRSLMEAGVPHEHLPDPVTVSTHALLGCSWHNQGCQGGYPFLAAKHVAEWGVPLEQYTPEEQALFELPSDGCMPYGSAGNGVVQQCNKACYSEPGKRAQDHLVRVKEYGYLGGPYGVCGQERIMDEIKQHGVVVAALEVDHSGHFSGARPNEVVDPQAFLEVKEAHASGKAFEHTLHTPDGHHRHDPSSSVQLLEAKWAVKEQAGCETAVTAAEVNEKMADFPGYQQQEGDSRGFGMNSDWMPTDMDRPFDDSKAALANAMGIEAECIKLTMVPGSLNGWEYTNHAITFVGYGTDDEQRDYWIIRNSWGPDYADNGHSFVPRGIDWGGIDSQIVTAKIDKDNGYFKHAFDKHLKAWKESDPASQATAQAAKEGATAAEIISPVLLEIDSTADSVTPEPVVQPTMSRLFPPLRHANTLIRSPQQKDARPVRDAAAATAPSGMSTSSE